ncbi:MAG TPA: thioredoxin family protein [Ignavibacteria bacterium]|nr:thioredoxin family protein [Ignavibacteria bacterium]
MAVNNNTDNLGSELIDFSLKGIDEKNYSPADFKNKDLIVIIFMCNHCPYVIDMIGRFVKFQTSHKNIQLIGINSNDTNAYPEDSFEKMKLFAADHKINFPYLFDETQETARKYGAVCTPDIFLYDQKRILRYRGRFDDNRKDESLVNEKDLEKAAELLLAGKEINFEQIPSIGCSIKWKN